jgi:hypothetical protein
MRSFLIGREALKDYIEECAMLALRRDVEKDADILRFVVHLVLYIDTVLPEFSFRLALPPNNEPTSLREELLLKYTNYLVSMSELWDYVPLYTSLLSKENILATFTDFLFCVHNNQQRQMMLTQARDFFPSGLDRYVLRNLVRELIQCNKADWHRGLAEDAPPAGVSGADFRMMRSVLWLCYYQEHHPDALVCANMLLRRFMLESSNDDQCNKRFLLTSKHFVRHIFPGDIIQSAEAQAQEMDETIAGYISLQMVLDLEAEFLSIKSFLEAHTNYIHFIDAINKTSPCHQTESKSVKGASAYETEIAQKMERNAFRQKKTGLCKIIIEYATKASDALISVLAFQGGWLVDQLNEEAVEDRSEEAIARLDEMRQIRSIFVPRALFMLHEVLNKTSMWMEQVVFDTLDQFGSASSDMLLALYSTFDNSEETTTKLLRTSPAAPAYWHKKAVSLVSIVANDCHMLHNAIGNDDMKKFFNLVADSQVRFNEWSSDDALFDL